MASPDVIVPLPGSAGPRDRRGRPLRDLRISVMDRCNLRCPYCMPRETFHERYRFLGSHERLSFDEIVRLARLFVRLGVRKLRLTGGEPLLRPNLTDLIGDLTAIDGVDDIALTTNGVLLAKYAFELRAGPPEQIALAESFTVTAPLTFFLPVQRVTDALGCCRAMPRRTHGSGDFTSLAATDGFVELPPGPNTYPAGFVAPLYRW